MLNPKNLSDRVKHVSFNTKRDVDKNIENKLQYQLKIVWNHFVFSNDPIV